MSYACLSASQNRLFPLGYCSKGLVVVETHLHRGERMTDGVKMHPVWGGVSYLKIYDSNYKVIRSEVLDTIKTFENEDYDSIITNTFNKGLLLAKNIPDFLPAKPTSISFCDYQQSCSKASLSFDTIKNQIFVRLPNKVKYPVTVLFDSLSAASNLRNYFSGLYEEQVSASSLKNNLYINSVRQLQIGQRKLTIVHMGYGHPYPPNKEYKPDFPFDDINKSVFKEPVLHHGHGFDFFILE